MTTTPAILALGLLSVHGDQDAPKPREEKPLDLSAYVGAARAADGFQGVQLERVTTAVPWPRGLIVTPYGLVVLARGRHRNAGGIDPSIPDRSGCLFLVDPDISEVVIRSEEAGPAVRRNGQVWVEPDPASFRLYDEEAGPPATATYVDRPYCTLAYDAVSENFFICGYSGIDLEGGRFLKNATDSILRYDLRDDAWHVVEQHDPRVVPADELGYVVPNTYYPHHDPNTQAAPHGLLNGPDGADTVGDYLYAVGKDNHVVAAYDLRAVRANPDAPAPAAKVVLDDRVTLLLDGEQRDVHMMGPSAVVADETHLYVGYRTSSTVLRFPIDASGALVQPVVGELIAVFQPWDAELGRSANLIDLALNSKGELFVACAEQGRIWNIGIPDPANVFDGNDQKAVPTTNRPYIDLREITSNPRARCGNITFDEDDRLYICSGNYDSGTRLAGVIYRAVPLDG